MRHYREDDYDDEKEECAKISFNQNRGNASERASQAKQSLANSIHSRASKSKEFNASQASKQTRKQVKKQASNQISDPASHQVCKEKQASKLANCAFTADYDSPRTLVINNKFVTSTRFYTMTDIINIIPLEEKMLRLST